MREYLLRSKRGIMVPISLALGFAVWQVSITLAQPPMPTPVSPSPGVDITAPGPAASIHGDPALGRVLFAQTCSPCHGVRGVDDVANPGSDDGTVPSLNPIDPSFIEDSGGDPALFARDIDLFIQHGSQPSGPSPQLSMPAYGDLNLLTQSQIADAEAYVMQLNGIYWPDRWVPPAEVQKQATQNGITVTYQITIVNHGAGPLGSIDLKDTLPTGLTPIASYVIGPGRNPGAQLGNTIEWINETGVPSGGTLGPFVIVAQAQGATIPPNVAQLFFTSQTFDGNAFSATALSQPTVP